MRDEKITALLSKYKSAVLSYSFDNHYKDHKPLEQGFDRCLMTDTKSHLYELITALFLELRLSQAQRYIAAWERTYIIDGWCADKDKESFDGLKAIGRFFIIEAKRIAVEVCEPEGDATPRGWGYLPPEQGTAEKGTDTNLETLLESYSTEKKKLNTDRAKKVFGKAIEKGLIEVLDNGLKWKESNALLAFLCGIIYCDDTQYQDAVTKERMVKRGSTFFPNKELCALFGFYNKNGQWENIKNLGQSRTQLERLPMGYEIVLKLIEVAK